MDVDEASGSMRQATGRPFLPSLSLSRDWRGAGRDDERDIERSKLNIDGTMVPQDHGPSKAFFSLYGCVSAQALIQPRVCLAGSGSADEKGSRWRCTGWSRPVCESSEMQQSGGAEAGDVDWMPAALRKDAQGCGRRGRGQLSPDQRRWPRQ